MTEQPTFSGTLRGECGIDDTTCKMGGWLTVSKQPTEAQRRLLRDINKGDVWSASRETVDECARRGWIVFIGRHYRLTPAGRAVLEAGERKEQ
jgi:hypothetical protein